METLYRQAKKRLSGNESADFILSQLFKAVFGAPLVSLRAREIVPAEAQRKRLLAMADRLAGGCPLAYVLGEWDFYGLTLKVGEGVLIPRPDTEAVVDAALALLDGLRNPAVADLCSGSGAIALAIASVVPQARVWAVEYSPRAFFYLDENIRRCGLAGRVSALCADVRGPLSLRGLDMVVANPPYIRTAELSGLGLEAEPSMALDGGADGLDFYRLMCANAPAWLRPKGALVFEVGYDQADAVAALMAENGFEAIGCRWDLGGVRRCVWGISRETHAGGADR